LASEPSTPWTGLETGGSPPRRNMQARIWRRRPGTSSRLRLATRGGANARYAPRPRPAPLFSARERAQIPALLAQGAEAQGWRGDCWATRCVAQVTSVRCGVYDHPAHVSRLLRQIGRSSRQPIPGAAQRDPAARRRAPGAARRGRNKAAAAGRTRVWLDEAGFALPGRGAATARAARRRS
jgi:transposase